MAAFALRCFSDQNVEHVSPFSSTARQSQDFTALIGDHFIQVPFVTGVGPVALDAIGEMAAKPVHPVPDGFPAYHHATFGKHLLHPPGADANR